MGYLKEKTFIIAKLEATPGTPETLAVGDNDLVLLEGELKQTIEFESPNFATGSHAELEDIAGIAQGTANIKAPFRIAPTLTGVPKIAKLFKSCGNIGAVEGTTKGYSLTPLATGDEVTLTIWEVAPSRGSSPVAIVRKLAGAMGTFKIGCDGIGKPLMCDFTYSGKVVVATDLDNSALTTINVLTGIDTAISPVLASATVTIGGTAHQISNFSLDGGVKVEPEYDPADTSNGAIKLFGVSSRAPRLSLNPLVKATATYDPVALARANTKATVIITLMAGAVPVTIKAPVAQILSPEATVREGLHAWGLNFKLEQNGTAASKVVADMAVEATYEILQGTKV